MGKVVKLFNNRFEAASLRFFILVWEEITKRRRHRLRSERAGPSSRAVLFCCAHSKVVYISISHNVVCFIRWARCDIVPGPWLMSNTKQSIADCAKHPSQTLTQSINNCAVKSCKWHICHVAGLSKKTYRASKAQCTKVQHEYALAAWIIMALRSIASSNVSF